MSHPAAISRWCRRTISRTCRRIRFLWTAVPHSRRTLVPKRVTSKLARRQNTTKAVPACRFPFRYTASKSLRRTKRHERGKASRPRLGRAEEEPPRSDNGEPPTAFAAATRENCASTSCFHARAETVRLVAMTNVRLISAFWQRQGSFDRASGYPPAFQRRSNPRSPNPRPGRYTPGLATPSLPRLSGFALVSWNRIVYERPSERSREGGRALALLQPQR